MIVFVPTAAVVTPIDLLRWFVGPRPRRATALAALKFPYLQSPNETHLKGTITFDSFPISGGSYGCVYGGQWHPGGPRPGVGFIRRFSGVYSDYQSFLKIIAQLAR